jgi:asparagine synthase (glutamine-hydrolysing)
MCGIVGMAGSIQASVLVEMNRLLFHRGPDDDGYYHDEESHVALAMRRLSILDVAHGHQPMSNRDGSTWIVYNGEIFNSPEIRRRLESKGRIFSTANSDTEILLHLYDCHQEDMLRDLNGMFAFVIFDRTRGILFGARDRMGIKPLYFVDHPSTFAFASELKSLLPLCEVERQIDYGSLFHYMSLRFVPGEHSILQGVHRLPAGHSFRYDLRTKSMKVQPYWHLNFQPQHGRSESEWAELLRHELKQAVQRWVLSDVPVGCSLSGGLDSSGIVGLLAELGSTPLRTYSLGFVGMGEHDWNELPLARKVAERWGTEHHEIILEPEDLLRDLVKMVWHLDEPYGGGIPSWYVFQFMSQHVKVGLTGTGGDELFGDYGRYTKLEAAAGGLAGRFPAHHQSFRYGMWETMWPFLTPLIQHVPDSVLDFRARYEWSHWPALSREPFRRHYFNAYYYFPDDLKRQTVFEDSARLRGVSDTSAVLESLYKGAGMSVHRDASMALALSTQLPDEFLLMTDRLSMAHSLEARVPFLDHRFVELVSQVPAAIRTKPGDPKYLLKRVIGDLLPHEVLHATKKGFVIPIELWLRGRLRPLAERLLAPDRLKAQGIFRPSFYHAYVQPHCEGRADYHAQVWTALMFQIWHVLFIEERLTEAPTFSWQDLC